VSVTMGFKCVDFRQFYMPYGKTKVKPTRNSIALRLTEWEQMKKVVELINNAYPALAGAIPCYFEDDHQNQLGALDCKECNPFMQ